MKIPDYSEFLAPLSNVSSVEDVHEVLSDLCLSFGFDYFLYCARIPTSLTQPSIVVVSGYPADWREHYTQQEYRRTDPTILHCATSTIPLIWDDLLPVEKKNLVARRIMEEAREFQLCKGVSLPVHTAQGETGILNLAASTNHTEIRRLLPSLHLLTAHLHEAMRLLVQVREVTSRPTLSPRERECLLWAAEGKTSWEISQIIGISERTVIFHLQNAGGKLEVNNRQQAVARALSLGLLTAEA